MTKGQILIDTELQQEYRIFYFDENSVNGIYIIDSETMGLVIHGADFIMKFDQNIFEKIKNQLSLKTLGFN
jgi:hypothetical protein